VASVMVASHSKSDALPKVMVECHRWMLSWWGEDREVRCGDYVFSRAELTKLADMMEIRDRFSVWEKVAETRLMLSELVRACFFVRTELYGDVLNSSSGTTEEKMLLVAHFSQTLIAGETGAGDKPGPGEILQSLKALKLDSIFGEYVDAIAEILRDE
jgi:hypothetical protein